MQWLNDSKSMGLAILLVIFFFGAGILWLGVPKALADRETPQAGSFGVEAEDGFGADADTQQIEVYFNERFLVGDYARDAAWADRRWGRNPFLTPAEIALLNGVGSGHHTDEARADSQTASAAKIVLVSDERKVVMLEDGRLLTEGDMVGNEIVADVDIGGVVLAGKNGTRRIDTPPTAIPLLTTNTDR